MRDITFVVYPDYSMMAFAVVMAFEVANAIIGGPSYERHFVSESGGWIGTFRGMTLESEPSVFRVSMG